MSSSEGLGFREMSTNFNNHGMGSRVGTFFLGFEGRFGLRLEHVGLRKFGGVHATGPKKVRMRSSPRGFRVRFRIS